VAIKKAYNLAISQILFSSARIMALFLAAVYLQSSAAIKVHEFLAAIQISSSIARNKLVFLASSRLLV
jgi:hypothetical protein